MSFTSLITNLIIINSCGFIESAKKESLNAVIAAKKNYPKAKVIVLTKNYRSTQEILDRSHDLVRFNDPDHANKLNLHAYAISLNDYDFFITYFLLLI